MIVPAERDFFSSAPSFSKETEPNPCEDQVFALSDYESDNERSLSRPLVRSRFFVALWRKKLLHHWVQQNHDGLPQKAHRGGRLPYGLRFEPNGTENRTPTTENPEVRSRFPKPRCPPNFCGFGGVFRPSVSPGLAREK